jgi:hypothetical protein
VNIDALIILSFLVNYGIPLCLFTTVPQIYGVIDL